MIGQINSSKLIEQKTTVWAKLSFEKWYDQGVARKIYFVIKTVVWLKWKQR